MASKWYITLLNDPQGFMKGHEHFLIAPFTANSTNTGIHWEFLDSLVNR